MRLILVLVMLVSIAYGQNDTTKYFKSTDYGWNWQRGKFRSAFILPTDTTYNKLGVVAIGSSLYVGNGTKWSVIGGGSTNIYNSNGVLTSNRVLNANNNYLYFDSVYTFKVDYGNSVSLNSYSSSQLKSDRLVLLQSGIIRMSTDSIMLYSPSGFVEQSVDTVLTMDGNGLVGYKLVSEFDSTSLSNRIDARLKYTDTASMLSPYLRSNVASATYATISNLALKVNISDTASMLSPYLRKVDTASLSNRINAKFTLPSLTSGSVLFSNGTTISQSNSNFFWDNSNVRLGIGTSASPSARLHVVGDNSTAEVIRFQNETVSTRLALYNAGTTSSNQIMLYRSRGSIASPSILSSGDVIGAIISNGYYDAGAGGYLTKASIDFTVDATPSSTNMPTAVVFQVSNSSAARAEAMRLSSAGNLLLGNTTGTDKLTVTGNINLNTAGNKIKIATGSNASIGTSGAMTAGTITISTTAVTSSSKIFLTHASVGGTVGVLSVGTITNATSFVINSSSALDTSTVNWWIIN